MRNIGLAVFAVLLVAACNNSAGDTTSNDSTTTSKDNTNVYDTGVGSSMTDTSKFDTLPNKMQDTGAKK
jgi:hypothetical protein